MGWDLRATSEYHEQARRWPDPYLSRTYRMTQETIDRLAVTAEMYQVGVSDLVRFLLNAALDQVDRGALDIPTTGPGLRRIIHQTAPNPPPTRPHRGDGG
jgi:hypothetical protein